MLTESSLKCFVGYGNSVCHTSLFYQRASPNEKGYLAEWQKKTLPTYVQARANIDNRNDYTKKFTAKNATMPMTIAKT
jgi:hypothetical protein